MNGEYPFVTVVMPVRNEAGFIERSLGAVVRQDYPRERMEVIVADGMSTDGTREILRAFQERYPNVRVIDNPGRIVPTGLNAAIAEAKGEIIVRVDGHCEIAPNHVRRCVEVFQETGADSVGGLQRAVGEKPMGRAVALAMSCPFGVGNARFRYSSRPGWVDTVLGAYRREVFARIGLFDEELVRNQDDEFNFRLTQAGGRIWLEPSICTQYYCRASLGALWRQYFQYGLYKVRLIQKRKGVPSWRHLVPGAFVVGLVGSLGMAILAHEPLYLLSVAVPYAVANVVASLWVARRAGWRHLLLLPLVFVTLHVSYGSGFLLGLCRFWNRWRKPKGGGNKESSLGGGPTGERGGCNERRFDNASSRR